MSGRVCGAGLHDDGASHRYLTRGQAVWLGGTVARRITIRSRERGLGKRRMVVISVTRRRDGRHVRRLPDIGCSVGVIERSMCMRSASVRFVRARVVCALRRHMMRFGVRPRRTGGSERND